MIIFFSSLALAFIVFSIWNYVDFGYDIKSYYGRPQLTDKDFLNAADKKGLRHLWIRGGIFGSSFHYRFDVYKDGSGRLQTWASGNPKEHYELQYIEEESGSILPEWQWYVTFTENLQSSSEPGLDTFKLNIPRKELRSIIRDFGDGSIAYEDIGGHCGNGINYYLTISINDKVRNFHGISHHFGERDYNIELLKWMATDLHPLFRENSEEIPYPEFIEIGDRFLRRTWLFNPDVGFYASIRKEPRMNDVYDLN